MAHLQTPTRYRDTLGAKPRMAWLEKVKGDRSL